MLHSGGENFMVKQEDNDEWYGNGDICDNVRNEHGRGQHDMNRVSSMDLQGCVASEDVVNDVRNDENTAGSTVNGSEVMKVRLCVKNHDRSKCTLCNMCKRAVLSCISAADTDLHNAVKLSGTRNTMCCVTCVDNEDEVIYNNTKDQLCVCSVNVGLDLVVVEDADQLLADAVRGLVEVRDGSSVHTCDTSLVDDLKHVKRALDAGARVSDAVITAAVIQNDVHILHELLVNGGNPNAVADAAGAKLGFCTVLGYAVKYGDIGVVTALLNAGANVDGRQTMQMTPLMWASLANRTSYVEVLLNGGANVNAVDSVGRSALLLGAADGCTAIIKLLLDAGANPNLHDVKYTTPLMNASGYGIRPWVAREPRWEVAKLLLAAGAAVNVIDDYGDTCLLIATKYDVKKVGQTVNMTEMRKYIECLLRAGAAVNAVGFSGYTPLLNACVSDLSQGEDVIKLLLDAGADIHAKSKFGLTCLMKAVGHSSPDIVQVLLQRGARVNDICRYGNTALAIAVARSHHKLVAMLLQAGGEINHQDISGTTPLMAAFYCDDDEFNEFGSRWAIGTEYCDDDDINEFGSRWAIGTELIHAGADVNVMDDEGNTAMLVMAHYSSCSVHTEADVQGLATCLSGLIDAGASVNVVDCYGRTPLMYICIHQKQHAEQIVHALLDAGANVNATDAVGNTALMYGANYNEARIMAVLLSRGANVNRPNHDGAVVSEWYQVHRCEKRLIMLMLAGADVSHVDVRHHPKFHAVHDEWKMLKLQLQHMCREKIRECVMTLHPGKRIEHLVREIGLPEMLSAYVADLHRYGLHEYDEEEI